MEQPANDWCVRTDLLKFIYVASFVLPGLISPCNLSNAATGRDADIPFHSTKEAFAYFDCSSLYSHEVPSAVDEPPSMEPCLPVPKCRITSQAGTRETAQRAKLK